MTYGTTSFDATKGVVLLSCIFNVFMAGLIFRDPGYLIASERGDGWWDVLKEIEDDARYLYPRIWAYRLLLELLVRVNWVFTVETAPALYRCVLMTYVLPFIQYMTECFVYKTLPPFNPLEMVMFNLPWFFLILNYKKYTTEPSSKSKKK